MGEAVLTHHPTSACNLARQPSLTLGLAPPLTSSLVSVRPGVVFPCGWAFSGEGVPTWGGDCVYEPPGQLPLTLRGILRGRVNSMVTHSRATYI